MNTTIAPEPRLVLQTSESAVQGVPAAPLTPVQKPRKARVWTAFATVFVGTIVGQIASLAAMIAFGLVVGIVMGAQGASGDAIQTRIQQMFAQPLPTLLLTLLPVQFGMAAVLYLALRRSQEPKRERIGLVPPTGRVVSRLRLVTLAGFTVSTSLLIAILSALLLHAAPTQNAISEVIDKGSWRAVMLLSILLSIIPALVEESLFRGYLLRRLLQRWSPAVAIGVTTLLFAMVHCDSRQHVLAVIPLGLITGLLAYRTKSIKPGMLVHAIHNATVVGIAELMDVLSARSNSETAGLLMIAAIVAMGLIGLPAVISLVRRPKPVAAVETQSEPHLIVEVPPTPSCRPLDRPATAIDSVLAGSIA